MKFQSGYLDNSFFIINWFNSTFCKNQIHNYISEKITITGWKYTVVIFACDYKIPPQAC